MSKIEWTDETWNPIAGCSVVSPGCTNCYAMNMAFRLERMLPKPNHYEGLTQSSKAGPVWTGKVSLAPERTLLEPLRRKKPTTYFVNSMSDLFHEDVPDEWIDQVFAVMAVTCDASQTGGGQHVYQVLTKRSARMRAYVANPDRVAIIDAAADALSETFAAEPPSKRPRSPFFGGVDNWPLPNVWLGVSAERQQEADARIPDLLATPAAVRFVSAEPLIEHIGFTRLDVPNYGYLNALDDGYFADGRPPRRRLDWIIVGGESGPGARPMHPDWARGIRDQCQAAGVPFFFKQHGAWIDHGPAWGTAADEHPVSKDWLYVDADGTAHRKRGSAARCARAMERVGKKEAGRLLDGREWNEMPAPAKEFAA